LSSSAGVLVVPLDCSAWLYPGAAEAAAGASELRHELRYGQLNYGTEKILLLCISMGAVKGSSLMDHNTRHVPLAMPVRARLGRVREVL
jgi:hypothetical protein